MKGIQQHSHMLMICRGRLRISYSTTWITPAF